MLYLKRLNVFALFKYGAWYPFKVVKYIYAAIHKLLYITDYRMSQKHHSSKAGCFSAIKKVLLPKLKI